MGRKGKTQKHTAAETAAKHKAARERAGGAGGGGKGAAARKAAGEKVAVLCDVCKMKQPNLKSMTLHFENKHPKIAFSQPEPGETKSRMEKFDEMFSANKATVKANDPKRIKKAKDSDGKGKASSGGKKKKKGGNDLSDLENALKGL